MTLTVTLVNGGSTTAGPGTLEVWRGAPDADGAKLSEFSFTQAQSHCRTPLRLSLTVDSDALPVGVFQIWARVTPANSALERDTTNNLTAAEFHRLDADTSLYQLRAPLLQR